MPKLTVLLIMLLLSITGCGNNNNNIQTLPPSYTMLCDGNGSYLPVMPAGTRLYAAYPHGGYSKRQDAINRAWRQYLFTSPPPDTVQWYDCTEERRDQ